MSLCSSINASTCSSINATSRQTMPFPLGLCSGLQHPPFAIACAFRAPLESLFFNRMRALTAAAPPFSTHLHTLLGANHSRSATPNNNNSAMAFLSAWKCSGCGRISWLEKNLAPPMGSRQLSSRTACWQESRVWQATAMSNGGSHSHPGLKQQWDEAFEAQQDSKKKQSSRVGNGKPGGQMQSREQAGGGGGAKGVRPYGQNSPTAFRRFVTSKNPSTSQTAVQKGGIRPARRWDEGGVGGGGMQKAAIAGIATRSSASSESSPPSSSSRTAATSLKQPFSTAAGAVNRGVEGAGGQQHTVTKISLYDFSDLGAAAAEEKTRELAKSVGGVLTVLEREEEEGEVLVAEVVGARREDWEELLTGLNQEQRQAVTASLGPVRVVAGPGSGKTRVLTHRVAHLLRHRGYSPDQIVCITFTNKAAKELKERLGALLTEQTAGRVTAGTFHGVCCRMLRENIAELPSSGLKRNFTIFDEKDSKHLIRAALEMCITGRKTLLEGEPDTGDVEEGVKGKKAKKLSDEMKKVVNDMGAWMSTQRRFRLGRTLEKERGLPEGLITGPTRDYMDAMESMRFKIMENYEGLLKENNAVDFDQLILLAVSLLRSAPHVLEYYQRRWKGILVDEFQDTDLVQYELVRLLTLSSKHVYVVGDVDQAIYGFRGANVKNMMTVFDFDYPKALTLQLRLNYRSTRDILGMASWLIGQSEVERKVGDIGALDLQPTKRSGGVAVQAQGQEYELQEASMVVREIERLVHSRAAQWGDCAVLFRTRMQSRVLEEALNKRGVPYVVIGGMPFYQRKEVKDLVAYLRLAANPLDSVSLERIINVPPRGIGKKTWEALSDWATGIGMTVPVALMSFGSELPDKDVLQISPRQRSAVANFWAMTQSFIALSSQVSVDKLLDAIIDKIGYMEYIPKDDEEIVVQLQSVALSPEWKDSEKTLVDFLEFAALMSGSEQEELSENAEGRLTAVKLMTMHAAKGLEFENVFVAGVEKGLMPHKLSWTKQALGEERRLLYVAITRAKQRLYLSWSKTRTLHFDRREGAMQKTGPSPFLQDIIHTKDRAYTYGPNTGNGWVPLRPTVIQGITLN